MTGRFDGPIEAGTWPDQLEARVVEPGGARVAGYAFVDDLAAFHGFASVLGLLLGGELPGPERAEALGRALVHCVPRDVGHAAVHAAVLTRLCGGRTSAVVSVAALTEAEHAERLLGDEGLLAWLRDPASPFPPSLRARDDEERALTAALAPPAHAARVADAGPDAAVLAAFFEAGLRDEIALVGAWVTGRLAACLTEARAVKPADFASYPMNLPAFDYDE